MRSGVKGSGHRRHCSGEDGMYLLRLGKILCMVGMATLLVWAGCAKGGEDDTCGNGICDRGESLGSCPDDCTGSCGNHICEPSQGETASSCPADCSTTVCGNGDCELGEDANSCPQDCSGPVCGDGRCEFGENFQNCQADCGTGPYCGNSQCEAGEDTVNCPQDCGTGPVCGNNQCEQGEDENNCPADCATGPVCGNNQCETGEDSSNCPQDCPPVCTDPVCDFVPQCGCGPGEKCTISLGDRTCIDVTGSTTESGVCAYDYECVAETLCITGVTGHPLCYRFCNVDSDCSAGPGSICISEVTYQGNPIPGAMLCSIDCNPVTNAGCPSGLACDLYIRNTDDMPLTDCGREAGTSMSACNNTTNPCPAGYYCDELGDGNCHHYCRMSGSDCAGVEVCSGFTPPADIGGTVYGVCF